MTNNTAHTPTPGPWRVEFNPNIDGHPRVMASTPKGRQCIASTIGTKTTRDKLCLNEKMANARLIAAAPTMWESIHDLLYDSETFRHTGGAYNISVKSYENLMTAFNLPKGGSEG